MNRLLTFAILSATMLFNASAAAQFRMEQLQGAWWSDRQNPTADFAIHGNEVWLDSDAGYHPCRVEENILIFELGAEVVWNRIVSLQGDQLVLEAPEGGQRRTLSRAKE